MSFSINYCQSCPSCGKELTGDGCHYPALKRCVDCRQPFFLCADCVNLLCPKCGGLTAPKSELLPDKLFHAIDSGDVCGVREVVEGEYIDVNVLVDDDGCPPLVYAACKGVYEICAYFVNECGADVFIKNSKGRTALIEMTRSRGGRWSKKIAELLSRTINERDLQGATALMMAASGAGAFGAKRGSVAIIKQFLQMEANLLLQDERGYTALGYAMLSNAKSPSSANDWVVSILEKETLMQYALEDFNRKYSYSFSDKGLIESVPRV